MRYSYINHRKKTIVSQELQLLFTFFGLTLFMLFSTYGFLLYKDYRFAKEKQYAYDEKISLQINIETMKKSIDFIEKESMLSEKIYTQNSVLKDSIANLFDLVPSRITLSEASLLENGLILYGITPNKDVYNFMLQAPLRSIFQKTYSSFYPAQNGWIRFVSTNYIEEDNDLNIEDDTKDEGDVEYED